MLSELARAHTLPDVQVDYERAQLVARGGLGVDISRKAGGVAILFFYMSESVEEKERRAGGSYGLRNSLKKRVHNGVAELLILQLQAEQVSVGETRPFTIAVSCVAAIIGMILVIARAVREEAARVQEQAVQFEDLGCGHLISEGVGSVLLSLLGDNGYGAFREQGGMDCCQLELVTDEHE